MAKRMDPKLDPERLELGKAYRRIGKKPADAMRWVIKFACEKPKSLSAGDRINRDYELVAFVRFGVPVGWKFPPYNSDVPWVEVPKGWGDAMSPVSLPTENEVLALQVSTAQYLNQLISEREFDVPIDIKVYRVQPVIRPVYHAKDPSKNKLLAEGYVIPVVRSPEAAFLYLLVNLMRAFVGKVKNCPECKKIFLKERKNQKYCSVTCQSRVATRKYLGITEDRRGKRGRPRKVDVLGKASNSLKKTVKPKRRAKS